MRQQLQNMAAVSQQGDGFDRLLMHYDACLKPASSRLRHPAIEELRAAIIELREAGLDEDGPAMARFARAWTIASRLVEFTFLSHRPAGTVLH